MKMLKSIIVYWRRRGGAFLWNGLLTVLLVSMLMCISFNKVDKMAVIMEEPPIPLPATINIKPCQVIGPLHKDLFGFNYWRPALEGALVDPATGTIDPDAATLLSGLPLPLNRVADMMPDEVFHWKETIGPMDQRPVKFIPYYKLTKPMYMGPIEWDKWLKSVDPNAGLTWVFRMENDLPDDHADLVEFLTGYPGHPRGDVDWAKKRQELGIVEPVNVKIWELGNEMDWGHKWTVEKYIEECRKTIDLVRAVDPDAKIAAHVLTAPNVTNVERQFSGNTWQEWHRAILRELGPDIDYLSFHCYYSGLPISVMEGYMNQIRDDILQITGSDRIKVYVSEHARWKADSGGGGSTHNLTGCLITAQFLLRCMTRPEVVAANYHTCIDGADLWGALFRDKTSGKFYSTGIVPLFHMFAKLPAGEVVATDVVGPQTSVSAKDLNFAATTVRSGKTLFLVIVNRSASRDVAISVSDGKNYRLKSGFLLTAPSPDSFNTYTDDPIAITRINIDEGEELPEQRLIPAYSMSILELEEQIE